MCICASFKLPRSQIRQIGAKAKLSKSSDVAVPVYLQEGLRIRARRAKCESASDDMVRISQPDKSLLLVISWTKSSSDQCAYMNICKCTQSSGFVVENFFEKICS